VPARFAAENPEEWAEEVKRRPSLAKLVPGAVPAPPAESRAPETAPPVGARRVGGGWLRALPRAGRTDQASPYWPEKATLDGTWMPPKIEKVR
jgi:hypothetical protein